MSNNKGTVLTHHPSCSAQIGSRSGSLSSVALYPLPLWWQSYPLLSTLPNYFEEIFNTCAKIFPYSVFALKQGQAFPLS